MTLEEYIRWTETATTREWQKVINDPALCREQIAMIKTVLVGCGGRERRSLISRRKRLERNLRKMEQAK